MAKAKITQSGILFDNFVIPNIATHATYAKDEYKWLNNGIPTGFDRNTPDNVDLDPVSSCEPFINSLNINWNGAHLPLSEKSVQNTGDLLAFIDNINNKVETFEPGDGVVLNITGESTVFVNNVGPGIHTAHISASKNNSQVIFTKTDPNNTFILPLDIPEGISIDYEEFSSKPNGIFGFKISNIGLSEGTYELPYNIYINGNTYRRSLYITCINKAEAIDNSITFNISGENAVVQYNKHYELPIKVNVYKNGEQLIFSPATSLTNANRLGELTNLPDGATWRYDEQSSQPGKVYGYVITLDTNQESYIIPYNIYIDGQSYTRYIHINCFDDRNLTFNISGENFVMFKDMENERSRVSIDLYDGKVKIPYKDGHKGSFIVSALPLPGEVLPEGLKWSFTVKDNTFFYRLEGNPKFDNATIKYEITYNDVKFIRYISIKTISKIYDDTVVLNKLADLDYRLSILEGNKRVFKISYDLTNFKLTERPNTINEGATVEIPLIQEDHYVVPETKDITVIGASWDWNKETKILKIYNPVSDIKVICIAKNAKRNVKVTGLNSCIDPINQTVNSGVVDEQSILSKINDGYRDAEFIVQSNTGCTNVILEKTSTAVPNVYDTLLIRFTPDTSETPIDIKVAPIEKKKKVTITGYKNCIENYNSEINRNDVSEKTVSCNVGSEFKESYATRIKSYSGCKNVRLELQRPSGVDAATVILVIFTPLAGKDDINIEIEHAKNVTISGLDNCIETMSKTCGFSVLNEQIATVKINQNYINSDFSVASSAGCSKVSVSKSTDKLTIRYTPNDSFEHINIIIKATSASNGLPYYVGFNLNNINPRFNQYQSIDANYIQSLLPKFDTAMNGQEMLDKVAPAKDGKVVISSKENSTVDPMYQGAVLIVPRKFGLINVYVDKKFTMAMNMDENRSGKLNVNGIDEDYDIMFSTSPMDVMAYYIKFQDLHA